ncbi:MAG: bifunctional tetrahydrofolate synthase/dihydrofolate synthase [Halieaceae bacterium]|jgi:dihydrofolate synthase / folylpolyglutamate synthase|nr:bifunctional tetrahydrofolate synthase/dihydrofolate synthase [Halieaceae bacterium]
MNNASLAQWLQRLESLHPQEIELGLERVGAVANTLQLLPVKQPVITVAGTNGKGSTVAVLEAVLSETGRVTGACTSPHLQRFNERIRIGGVEVEDAEIIRAFEQIEVARGSVSLTFFEFATLAALVVFRNLGVDVVILEVGLGGRLDAVNIVDASVAVITSIDLDHEAWLGTTREVIAREKAGIFRAGSPAIVADLNPPGSLLDCATETDALGYYIGQDFHVHETADSWRASLSHPDGTQRHIFALPWGALIVTNVVAALQALLLAGEKFTDQQVKAALTGIQLPGRRELRKLNGRDYLLDVAHNPAAVDKLLEYTRLNPCRGKTIALFSAMADKHIHAMIRACGGYFDAWFLADQPDNPRAAPAEAIADFLQGEGSPMINVSDDITQAFRQAQAVMSAGDRLVVFGSFYTVVNVMEILTRDNVA